MVVDDSTEVFQEIPLKLQKVPFCDMVKFNNTKKIFQMCQRYMKNAAAVTETASPCFGNEDLCARVYFRHPFFIPASVILIQPNGSALNFLLSGTQLEVGEYFLLFFVNIP